MAQEIEQMVRLRLVQSNGTTDKATAADDSSQNGAISESAASQLSPADQAVAKRK